MSSVQERFDSRWYHRLARLVYVACGVLLLVVWSVVALELSELRVQRERELALKAEALSQVYSGYVERILGHVDTALLLLRDAYVRDRSAVNQDFVRITNLLRRGPLQDIALQVAVIGADGFVEFSDLRRPDKPVDLSDRAHFQVHLRSAADMLYVSRPVKGRVSGRWSIQLTRRISDPSGKFLGVVVISVSPEVFAAAGPTMGLDAGDVLTLLDSDVNILARFPADEASLGKPLPPGVKSIIQTSGAPRLRPSGVDGKVRMIAYHALAQYPLLAGVSLNPDGMEAAIAGETWSRVTAAALFSLAVVLAGLLSLRSLRQREVLSRELLRQRQHFSDAQEVAQLGSWECFLSDRVAWSEGMFRIFGLPRESLEPSVEEWRAHVHPDDRAKVDEAFERCRESATPYRVEYRLASSDGSVRVVLERGAMERDERGRALRMYGMVMDITDQRRLESSLREAEQRLGWALEAARDGVWDWHVDTGQVYFSPRWKEMLGYRPDEFENTLAAWHAAVHPQDLPRMRRAFDDYFSGHSGRYECEVRMRCKDGAYRWILARGQTFRHDANGRPLRMLGTHSDVTDRKAAEQALRVERSRLAEAQAVAHLGSWEWDVSSRTLWWSRETYRIFGLPLSFEPSYESFLQCVSAEDRQSVAEAIHVCLDGRLPFDVEHRILRPDGEERVVREQGRGEFDESGRALRMMGVVQDLTESHRLEQALRDADARWMFALDGAGTGVWDWDRTSGKAFFSLRWKEMLGYAPREIGDSIDEWRKRVHPDDAVRVQHEVDRHLEGLSPVYESEHRLRTKDGHYCWVLDRGRVVARDAGGRAQRMIGTHTDITARKEAEVALQDSESRYRTLIASMAEGVVLQDATGRIKLCNDAACALLGVEPSGLLGKTLAAAEWSTTDEHGQPIAPGEHPCSKVLNGMVSHNGVVLGLTRSDGRRAWLSMNCQPLERAFNGGGLELVTTFSDITRIKEAEFASRLGDTVVEQTSQPIVVTDRQGAILRANPAFCRSFGFRLEDLVGRQVGAVVRSGRQDAAFYRQMWQALQDEGAWRGEIWNRRRNGEEFPEWLSITALRDLTGRIEQFVGVYTDITERKNLETAMWRAANFDALTDLPNRMYFTERLHTALARARRTQTRVALLFVDLDRFKPVNDTYGHYAGDQVLQTVARRLVACVREDDVVARLGGDEFVVLLQNLGSDSPVERVVQGLLASVEIPIDVGGKDVTVGCSIGMATYPEQAQTAEALMQRADEAMYVVKGQRDGATTNADKET